MHQGCRVQTALLWGSAFLKNEEEGEENEENQNKTAAPAFDYCDAWDLLLHGSAGYQYSFDRMLGVSARAWHPRRADLYQEEKSEQV